MTVSGSEGLQVERMWVMGNIYAEVATAEVHRLAEEVRQLSAQLAEHIEWHKEFIAGQVAYHDGSPWRLNHSDAWQAGWALSDFNSREND